MSTQPATLDEAYRAVLEELFETFIKKHKDYGKGNILSIEELGIALRESEKVERLKNLLKKTDDPANESLDDTWMDIAVYAIIAILYRRKQFQSLEVAESLMK
jgi:hypothetical protein